MCHKTLVVKAYRDDFNIICHEMESFHSFQEERNKDSSKFYQFL